MKVDNLEGILRMPSFHLFQPFSTPHSAHFILPRLCCQLDVTTDGNPAAHLFGRMTAEAHHQREVARVQNRRNLGRDDTELGPEREAVVRIATTVLTNTESRSYPDTATDTMDTYAICVSDTLNVERLSAQGSSGYVAQPLLSTSRPRSIQPTGQLRAEHEQGLHETCPDMHSHAALTALSLKCPAQHPKALSSNGKTMGRSTNVWRFTCISTGWSIRSRCCITSRSRAILR